MWILSSGRIKITVLLILVGVSLSVLLLATQTKVFSSDAKLISNYKHWARVNDESFIIDSVLAIQCSLPTAEQMKKIDDSPHGHKFVIVYVNDIGSNAMLKEKTPHFPQGSIIVKEKLEKEDSAAPELLTVMVKREAGFNPDNGDWEFMVFDGAGKKIQAQGRLENCQACHLSEKKTDYVSRRYLTWDQMQQMK